MKIRNGLKMLPAFLFVYLALAPSLSAEGHFELNFHYGTWNLNLLGSTVENSLSDALESAFEEVILEEIQKDYPDLQYPLYDQTVEFDSGGHNYGFEIRWYPGGHEGSFSLGFSLEKTKMEIMLKKVEMNLTFDDGSTFHGESDGETILNPLTFHMSVRWDIMPKSPVHPYITLGVGVATFSSIENDIVSYSWLGELDVAGGPIETYEDSGSKTIQEIREDLEEEEEDFPLSFLPFLQLNLGLKGRITRNIHLMLDAGIWNGFIIRGGIAIRL
jgi:hypothetical protein